MFLHLEIIFKNKIIYNILYFIIKMVMGGYKYRNYMIIFVIIVVYGWVLLDWLFVGKLEVIRYIGIWI